MEKPGPKTDAAKAAVRYNALRHGILSPSPVISGFEREEVWQAHYTGILASLAPQGELELELAERIAISLWRLRRVVQYERETIGWEQQKVDKIYGSKEPPDRLDRLRHRELLPNDVVVQKIVRYEAHLNRQLYQAMHELEALQARRHGQPAPLARLDVQGMPEP